MAHFLRDQRITNLSLDEDSLRQINAVFESREVASNVGVSGDDIEHRAILSYIIRFDGKGYRVFSITDLLRYFHQAKEIERILFTIETGESLRTSRIAGTYMELRLDEKDPVNCNIIVTSNHSDWVEASFSAAQDVLIKFKNNNGWARTAWTQLAVQIIGVSFGFLLSIWAAVKISPALAIENSFVISFLFVLLLFSNTWTFLNQQILSYINTVFPNLKFFRPRKNQLHWVMQALIGGMAFAVMVYVLNLLFSYFSELLSSLVKKNL